MNFISCFSRPLCSRQSPSQGSSGVLGSAASGTRTAAAASGLISTESAFLVINVPLCGLVKLWFEYVCRRLSTRTRFVTWLLIAFWVHSQTWRRQPSTRSRPRGAPSSAVSNPRESNGWEYVAKQNPSFPFFSVYLCMVLKECGRVDALDRVRGGSG